MKKLLVIAIAGLAMASCRKDLTCTCTEKSDVPGFSADTYVYTYKDTKKKDAKKACQSYTTKQTAPVASTYANDYGMNCELK